MKLYGYWRSSCTWRVRIGLDYMGIAYTYMPVHLINHGGEQKSAEHRARNGMLQVPTLELDDGRQISQSLAIVRYLETLDAGDRLLPSDAYQKAIAWQMAEIVNAGIQPLQNLALLQKIKAEFSADAKAWSAGFIAAGLEALEALAVQHSGKFLVGDEVSVADACLVPQMYNARRFAMDLNPYPTLVAVDARCMELDAFISSRPSNQADAT